MTVSLLKTSINFALVTLGIIGLCGWKQADSSLPAFGLDTVLVYRIQNQDLSSKFVVRIAEFAPERFFEWENQTMQGTVLLAEKAVDGAKKFVNERFFEGGVEKESKDATTLWLSRRLFRELKEKGTVKLSIDSLPALMTVQEGGKLPVQVNGATMELAVIKVEDSRGAERWFLDSEDNPLQVKFVFRQYTQTLDSITTDRTNTLRWIKGRKLKRPD